MGERGKAALRWGKYTHTGRKDQNEDYQDCKKLPPNRIGARGLTVLADGMGGYNAGEVASEIAVKTVLHALEAAIAEAASPEHLAESIELAVEEASNRIYRHTQSHPECAGMGTTIAVTVTGESWLVIGNVGDSRIYLLADGIIEQLSEDHTALAETLKARPMSEEEKRNFPHKHSITRCLGNQQPPRTFTAVADLPENAIVMLCSDGATDVLDDSDLRKQFEGTPDIQTAVENIVRLAYHRDSRDNITVVAVEYGVFPRVGTPISLEPPIPAAPRTVPTRPTTGRSRSMLPLLAGLLALLLIGAGGVAYLLFKGKTAVAPAAAPSEVQTGSRPTSATGVSLDDLRDKRLPVPQAPKGPVSGRQQPVKPAQQAAISPATGAITSPREPEPKSGSVQVEPLPKAPPLSPPTQNPPSELPAVKPPPVAEKPSAATTIGVPPATTSIPDPTTQPAPKAVEQPAPKPKETPKSEMQKPPELPQEESVKKQRPWWKFFGGDK
jgi:protein phosphatase